ncbi:VOC family protein [Micromonospora sp. B11E3]|uniref:VOC family protein n=1 Tax=Micromonospora sp. B11E3 TaxID=3153562 RepID=UPI00325DD471
MADDRPAHRHPLPLPAGEVRGLAVHRMHWDVDLAGPDPTRLITAGATLLREPDADIRWWVLADPEGNEFCAFAPGPAA